MPRVRGGGSPSDTADDTEDTEGHMPRLKRWSPSDTVEDTDDTEGHMPRLRGGGSPSDTADDTEGHARSRP